MMDALKPSQSVPKLPQWVLRLIVAIPFVCLWGSLDAVRGAASPRFSLAWIFPLLISCSLVGIGVQLEALRRRGSNMTALEGQFLMGILLTLATAGALWSSGNLASIQHAYQTIPFALVLPALTLVALANALVLHFALRKQPLPWDPAVSPRFVVVAESLIALVVAGGSALVVVGALYADRSQLARNLQWGGLIVLAVALVQLAVSVRIWQSISRGSADRAN